jgi:hypothetical protein
LRYFIILALITTPRQTIHGYVFCMKKRRKRIWNLLRMSENNAVKAVFHTRLGEKRLLY